MNDKINEIKKELNRAFDKYEFFPKDHHYECNGKRVGISVTTFYDQYVNEFEQQAVAEKCAIRDNKTIDEVLKEWKYKNDFSKPKGTNGHNYAQSLFNNEKFEELPFDNSIEFKNACSKVYKQADNFYKEYKDILVHIADEFVVGSEEYDIASAIDHLFYNKLTGNLVLVDYKTNRILKGYNDELKNRKYTKKMKVPLQNIKDDVLHHYYIQLSIYIYLIEKYTNLKVDEYFIVYFSEDIENYEIIKIDYLKDEVEKILEMRRVKNMKSISILVLGKSGSGKSSSLRNLSTDEYSLVNPLGKELPFKCKSKGLESDNYDLIKKFYKETPKKLVITDDSNYLITNQFMRTHSKGGTGNAVFAVYNTLADEFWNLIQFKKNLDGGKVFVDFMHEDETEDGYVFPKTIGKLLNEKVCIEGMYTVVIRAMYKEGKYIFKLKSDGTDCVKTPIDMFEESECENDLKYIVEKVREYYELDENQKEENKKDEEK